MRIKLLQLEEVIRKEIKNAQRIAEGNKRSAIESAKTAAVSWSAAGDRWHAAGQAQITKERLFRLEKLYLELKGSTNQSLPEQVSVPSYIKVNFGGEVKELYLVENPTLLGQYQLISRDSPIGSLLLGKKPGDVVMFNAGNKRTKIEILEVD